MSHFFDSLERTARTGGRAPPGDNNLNTFAPANSAATAAPNLQVDLDQPVIARRVGTVEVMKGLLIAAFPAGEKTGGMDPK